MNARAHHQTAHAIFSGQFEISPEKPFDQSWSAKKYFGGLVDGSNDLPPGEVFRSTDPEGRKLLVVGTAIGNVVVFQRNPKVPEMYGINSSEWFKALGLTDSVSVGVADMNRILGPWGLGNNVGVLIEKIGEAWFYSRQLKGEQA